MFQDFSAPSPSLENWSTLQKIEKVSFLFSQKIWDAPSNVS